VFLDKNEYLIHFISGWLGCSSQIEQPFFLITFLYEN